MEQKEKRIYTIEDIAAELGISKATVSRAMTGHGRISPATKERVLEFIEAHNYRPSAAAKGLAKNRTYNLGLVLPGNGEAAEYAFFQSCMLGICEMAAQKDYDVLIAVHEEGSLDGIRRILDNRKVDGMITARSVRESSVISLLQEREIPFIVIGSGNDPEVLQIDNNNQAACRDLIALLITRGIRRMALFCGSDSYEVTHARYRGFADACRGAGVELEQQIIFRNLSSHTDVSGHVRTCLQAHVDCIVCMDDYLCNMVVHQIKEQNARIPEDVKVACFYDSEMLANMVPPVTSLRFDAVELGRIACRELIQKLEGQEAKSVVLPGYQMILRDSTNES